MSLPKDSPYFNRLDEEFLPDKLPTFLIDGLYKIADRKGYSTLSQYLHEEAFRREEIDVQEQYEKFSQSNTTRIVSSMENK